MGVLCHTEKGQLSKMVVNQMERRTSKELRLADSQPCDHSLSKRHLRSGADSKNIRERRRQSSELELG